MSDGQERTLRKHEQACRDSNTTQVAGWCPQIFDGIMCWPWTHPSTLRVKPCPHYFLGFYKQHNASKWCEEDGSWLKRWDPEEGVNDTWTNFTECFDGTDTTVIVPLHNNGSLREDVSSIQVYLPFLQYASAVGYGVSFVSLIIAFSILVSFKRLRCPRNSLHAHLFLSFMMRAGLSLLKYLLMAEGLALRSDLGHHDGHLIVASQVHWSCKALTTVWQYFILANYSWLLVEGLYLHNLIFLALFSDTSAITSYILLGWLGPVGVVVAWVVVKATLDDYYCWTMDSPDAANYSLIINGSIQLSVLVNFVLFLNIVRVLHLKLTASISEEQRRFRYRRWAKSTLVLVPLFGAHYVFFVWMDRRFMGITLEFIFLFTNQIFTCLQGFIVSVLYCFLNGEVRAEVVKKWRHWGGCGGGRACHRPVSRFMPRLPSHKNCNNSTVVESSMMSYLSTVGPEPTRRPTQPQLAHLTTHNDPASVKLID